MDPITKSNLEAHEIDPSLTGSLLWLTATRPDIAYAVSIVASGLASPKRVLRYLIDNKNFGLKFYYGRDIGITGYSDSDWAGDPTNRKSRTGFVYFMSGAPIMWMSKRQSIIALSSTEAEYIAIASAVKGGLFIRNILEELGYGKQVIQLKVDNTGARLIAGGAKTSRSKHIEVRYFFVKELAQNNEINIEMVRTDQNVSDIFTKALGPQIFARHRGNLVQRKRDILWRGAGS
jgi:hypothetical protein